MPLPEPASAASGGIPPCAGIGLRHPHHRAVAETRPPVGWLEVHSENYLAGAPLRRLEAIRRDYPVSLHGVGLSLGTSEGLDGAHLAALRALVRRIEPGLVSEHLAWTTTGGVYLNDLLPLPYTEEALAVVCRNVARMQEALGRRVLVENSSTYLRFRHSTIAEPEFLAEIVRRTGCGLLLDVNNLYVSACNHGFEAEPYLAALPAAAVGEIHLAGHHVRPLPTGEIRIDDHGSAVAPAVWALYRRTLARTGRVPTLIEWDSDIPPLPVLLGEAETAARILAEACHDAAA